MSSRRTFLKIAGATAALGLGGAGYVALRMPREYPDASNFSQLDGQAVLVLQRLADIWLPGKKSVFTDWANIEVIEYFDHRLSLMNAELVEQVLLGIKGFDYAAFVMGLHGKPFSQLEDTAATSYVQSWMSGNIQQKQLTSALRMLLLYGYWRDDRTWGPTNYQGPLYKRANIPALGAAPLPS